MRCIVLLTALILLSGIASATGRIDAPLASVHLENGHTDHCVESATGLCPASADLADPTNGWIDVTEDNVRITVAYNDSELEHLTQLELLPDRAIVIDIRKIALPNPGLRALTAEDHRYALPGDQYGIRWNSSQLVIWLWGPSVSRPFSGLDHREQIVGYGSGWVTPERIGGLNDLRAPMTSDELLDETPRAWCERLPAEDQPGCRASAREITDRLAASSPNVRAGLGIDEIGAGDAEHFADPAGLGDRGVASPIGPRAPALPPSSRLDRESPVALPLGSAALMAPVPKAEAPTPPARGSAGPRVVPAAPEGDGSGNNGLLVPLALAAVLALVATILYSRITERARAVEAPVRAALVEHLLDHGPTSVHELSLALSLHRTTILHHARILQRVGEVRVARQGRHAILALPGQTVEAEESPRGALARVLDVLREKEGGATRADLHALLADVPARTRNHAIRELVQRGLVVEVPERLALATSPPPHDSARSAAGAAPPG